MAMTLNKKSVVSNIGRATRVFGTVLLLLLLLLLPQNCNGSYFSSPTSVTFTVFDNGSSVNGVDVTLTEDEFPSGEDSEHVMQKFAVQMSHIDNVKVSKYGQDPNTKIIATKAFREDGERIVSFNQLHPDSESSNKRRIYLVADGLEFVWPFVQLGHLQTISTRALQAVDGSKNGQPVVLESISDSPRVFKVLHFFTHEESDFLIESASKDLHRSTVGSGDSGAHSDKGRTSENSWDSSTKVAKRMITRSFNLTGVVEDVGKIDGLQLVRYKPGQFYNEHPDYFSPGADRDWDFNPYSGGSNRFATVFMYINDVEEGGCTVFPRVPNPNPTEPPQYALDMFDPNSMERKMVKKCHSQIAVPPKQGTAALFYSITPDGRIDPMSHHGACPVIKGLKWGANIWIWNKQRYGNVKTGAPRKLQIRNTLDETVYLSWEGKPDGEIRPGAIRSENTFEFHRFKAHLNSHKHNPPLAEYTVQTEPKDPIWTIERPRSLSLDHLDNNNNDGGRNKIKERVEMIEQKYKRRRALRGAATDPPELDPEHSEDL